MSRSLIRNINTMINNSVVKLSVEEAFKNDLSASIERSQDRRTPSVFYKPSSLTCMRQMYYQVIGAEPESSKTKASFIAMGNVGTDRHERIQNSIIQLAKNNPEYVWVDVETYVTEKEVPYLKVVKKTGNETKCFHELLKLSFMCDGILNIKGEYFILEIKTEGSMKFYGRSGIAEDHVTQATCYSTAFGIDKVIFLYESRDSLDQKMYLLNVTSEMKDYLVVNKINECEGYVARLVSPPKSTNRKHCTYCNYAAKCRKEG